MSLIQRFANPLGLAWLIALTFVAVRFFRFIGNGWFAVRYPYEIDYGEGIVWQQADMILAGTGYGDITRFPFIVFHYPPIYHLAASATDLLFPGDWLAAGRLVALVSTLACACLCSWLVLLATRKNDDRAAGAILAAIMFLSAAPVVVWGALARVDMLALALCLGGLVAGIKSFEKPKLIILGAFLFVLALFTRQTAIFAPAALFGTMLLIHARLAFVGIGWSTLFGLAGLGLTSVLTDGRFVEHIFLYNVNRFSFAHFQKEVDQGLLGQPQYWVLTLLSAIFLVWALWRSRRESTIPSVGALAGKVCLSYLAFSLISLVLVAKLGSNVNYFVDLCAAAAILSGMAAARVSRQLLSGSVFGQYFGVGLIIAVMWSAVSIPAAYVDQARKRPAISALDQQVREIRVASKPVLSDDMVVIRKAGKQVVWEPAIFSELAHAGMWDEKLIVQMIDDREFAFIRTIGTKGMPLFDARYRPAVIEAIDRAYPVTVKHEYFFANHYPDARTAAAAVSNAGRSAVAASK
jgi:hypothetical protein